MPEVSTARRVRGTTTAGGDGEIQVECGVDFHVWPFQLLAIFWPGIVAERAVIEII